VPRVLSEFLAAKPPDIESYIEHRILPKQGKLMLFAEAGIGKSRLVHNAAFNLAMGQPWAGLVVPRPVRVLYWIAEGSPDYFWERTFLLDQHYKCSQSQWRDNLWLEHNMDVRLDTLEGAKRAAEVFTEAKPEVIILDPLYKLMRGEETDQRAGKAVADFLDAVVSGLGCSIMLVHHSRKRIVTSDGRVVNQGKAEARGHTTITQDWPDTEVQMRKTKDGFVLSFEKVRFGEEPDEITVRFGDDHVASVTERTLMDEVLDVLKAGPMAKKDLAVEVKKRVQVSKTTLERELKALREGKVVQVQQSDVRKNEVVLSLR